MERTTQPRVWKNGGVNHHKVLASTRNWKNRGVNNLVTESESAGSPYQELHFTF